MKLDALTKAEVLIEALPYIKHFYGKTVVIKYGGHAMTDEKIKQKIISDIVLMKFVGINPVIVHGGGPDINYWLEQHDHQSTFVDGLRVTDELTMEVAQMVLIGKINKEIVGLIEQKGAKSIGLSGIDGSMIQATRKKMIKDGKEVDLGYVGQVEEINTELIDHAIAQGYIPVISPVGCNKDGEVFNINADYVAGSIAASLKADKFFLLTDINGVLDKDGSLISILPAERIEQLIKDHTICGGMIPKVQCCLNALKEGVHHAHIINGCLTHSLLLEIFTDEGIGTMMSSSN